jgi:hypothetical protein
VTLTVGVAMALIAATPETLAGRLAAAGPGDVLRLAPGEYGRVEIRGREFEPRLRIEAGEARLQLVVRHSAGIDVDGGRFVAATAKSPRDSGLPMRAGYAAEVRDSSHVRFAGGQFSDSVRGLVVARSSDIELRDLRFDRMSSDGINIAGGQRVLVERVECHDFAPHDGAHPDCVQLWASARTGPTADVTVRDSLARGTTMGFTAFNHPEKGQIGFDRLRFINNRAEIRRGHGVSVYDCRNCEVRGNQMTTLPDSRNRVAVRAIRCEDCVVEGNRDGDRPARGQAARSGARES